MELPPATPAAGSRWVGGEPRDEPLGVGGGKHGPQHHPAVEANRADQGQGLAPIHGHGVDECSAALHPGVIPTHRGVDAGLVHQDQTIDGDCADAPQEPAPLGPDGWPRHLRRPPPFFLTTSSCRCNARFIDETCTRPRPRRGRLYVAVNSPAVGSPRATSKASRSAGGDQKWTRKPGQRLK